MSSSSINRASTMAVVSGVAAAGYLLYKYWDDAILCSPRSPQKLEKLVKGSAAFLGDAPEVTKNIERLYDYWLERVEEKLKEGKTGPFVIRLPFQAPLIFVIDEESLQHILKDKFPVYDKGMHLHVRMKDLLGNGIFNIDGETWRHQRKTASNIFNIKVWCPYCEQRLTSSFQNFKDFVGTTFVEEFKIFSGLLKDAATSGQVINLQDLFFRFTLDSFSKVAFGADLGCLSSKEPVPFAVAFDDSQYIIFKRFFLPMWPYLQALNGESARQVKNIKVIQDFCYEFVDTRLKQLEDGTANISHHDLLQFLMESTVPATGQRPTRENLLEYVINFIIAGRDTTAQTLSWVFYMLHQHPLAAETLLREIEEVAANLSDEEHVSYDQVKNMKYANAVFHETLRLYPSVPTETKQANQDDYLPDGTFVPKGGLVTWNPYVMGRLTSLWGPDAKEFRPERWLEMDKQPSPFKYMVFNAGPRVCLGKNFAELEGVFVIVETLRRFKIEVLNAESVTYSPSLTLPIKNGLSVRVAERK